MQGTSGSTINDPRRNSLASRPKSKACPERSRRTPPLRATPKAPTNFLALAFGVFVVGLVVFGSLLIMANLDANMMPSMDQLMKMQR